MTAIASSCQYIPVATESPITRTVGAVSAPAEEAATTSVARQTETTSRTRILFGITVTGVC